eukprot:CAMPEP_0175152740 /NCGR_PEP_ID=MMETSP0087-20121206/19300_1 /TAXON_ID=136419 /ORGANISM="Unknown Unknown, Strain D1" /LENGTH=245 /DNA_ID=CAMNT_0016439243 /DNA_START=69 /DNA_END=802 /DNA_ORIENTATION=-
MTTLDKGGRYIALANMLSGGVFMGGGLCHLLPESSEQWKEFSNEKKWSEAVSDFPVPSVLAGVGFFLILLLEEVSQKCLKNQEDKEEKFADSVDEYCTDFHLAGPVSADNIDMLRLYYKRRSVARSVLTSLNPRGQLQYTANTPSAHEDGEDNARTQSLPASASRPLFPAARTGKQARTKYSDLDLAHSFTPSSPSSSSSFSSAAKKHSSNTHRHTHAHKPTSQPPFPVPLAPPPPPSSSSSSSS